MRAATSPDANCAATISLFVYLFCALSASFPFARLGIPIPHPRTSISTSRTPCKLGLSAAQMSGVIRFQSSRRLFSACTCAHSLYHKFDSIRENLLTKPPSIDMGQSKPVVVSFKLISPNCPPHSMAAPRLPPPLSQLIMQQLQRWCAKEREAQNERRLARTLASVLAST